MKNVKEVKIARELTYNKIYERMFKISGRRKLIKKTISTKIRLEKILTIKKTIA